MTFRTLSIALALCATTAFSAQVALAGACDADPKQELPKDTITASWYGKGFNGHRTTSGVKFDENKLTAAHATLPLNTVVEVKIWSRQKGSGDGQRSRGCQAAAKSTCRLRRQSRSAWSSAVWFWLC